MHGLPIIKIMGYFLGNPYEEVYLRELAKNLKLSAFTIKKYADLLVKEGLIKEERKANLRYFKPNLSNLFFKHLKIAYNLNTLSKSGLVDFIKTNLANISSIVLFGSIARGEDDKKSDVDILIIANEAYLNFSAIERKINRTVTAHIFSWSGWNKKAKQDKAFYYEIISGGIPLYGELPIVK